MHGSWVPDLLRFFTKKPKSILEKSAEFSPNIRQVQQNFLTYQTITLHIDCFTGIWIPISKNPTMFYASWPEDWQSNQ